MKKIALAATLIFSTIAAFNNTGTYLMKLFATESESVAATSNIKLTEDFVPMIIKRGNLAQADGDQQ